MLTSLAHRISSFNRERKWQAFRSLVEITPELRVLDVGFCNKECGPADNYLEKRYPYLGSITALGVDEPTEFRLRYPEVKVVRYDGRAFPFAEGTFDVVWSNAVIEHVGDGAAQQRFLREIARVGKRAFITTPNRHFPVELHTRTPLLHYLPKAAFDAYLRAIGKRWATGAYMNLLSRRRLTELLDEAGIEQYTVIENRLGGFVLDFVIFMDKRVESVPRNRSGGSARADHPAATFPSICRCRRC